MRSILNGFAFYLWGWRLSMQQTSLMALGPRFATCCQGGAAYLEVHNTGGKDASLISASSDISETVELHEHTMSDGMMRMRKMERIIIPPGATMTFEPGGKHLMLIGLKRPLEAGKQFWANVRFEGIGEQKLGADSERMTWSKPGAGSAIPSSVPTLARVPRLQLSAERGNIKPVPRMSSKPRGMAIVMISTAASRPHPTSICLGRPFGGPRCAGRQ